MSERELKSGDDGPEWLRRAVFALFVLFFLTYEVALGVAIWAVFWREQHTADPLLTQMLTEHFAAIVGLPNVSLMAFVVVWAFRQSAGPMEIELPGLKLKGAAGPVLLWGVLVLLLAWAIRLVW